MKRALFCIHRAWLLSVLLACASVHADNRNGKNPDEKEIPGHWPQEYTVKQEMSEGKELLILSTPYCRVEHDLKRGGVISGIAYTYGKVSNLLCTPVESRVRTAGRDSRVMIDSYPAKAEVSWSKTGLYPTVEVDRQLVDENGNSTGITIHTTYRYRWGYVHVRRVFSFPAGKGLKILELTPFAAVFHPSLADYGYRRGIAEQESGAFGFGVCQWGKIRPGTNYDTPVQTRFVPRYITLANHGIEGIEWFVSSDLSQWDYQLTGSPGNGSCYIGQSLNPSGITVTVSALNLSAYFHVFREGVAVRDTYTFDFYIGMPILEGHANPVFANVSFQRNSWPTEETIKNWAESGIKTAHFHHDGDSFNDGMFWRDGTYPPFGPDDMKEYDRVIDTCHRYGIRVATYFSNKELHPTTEVYKKHAEEWGRKPDDRGILMHNYYQKDEFGAQMCLKSGWLDYLQSYVDTVLKNHKLDGTYFD